MGSRPQSRQSLTGPDLQDDQNMEDNFPDVSAESLRLALLAKAKAVQEQV